MPVILVTQEAEIRGIVVQSQPWQIVLATLSQKYPIQKRALSSNNNNSTNNNKKEMKETK
jgi:hypothetical protein